MISLSDEDYVHTKCLTVPVETVVRVCVFLWMCSVMGNVTPAVFTLIFFISWGSLGGESKVFLDEWIKETKRIPWNREKKGEKEHMKNGKRNHPIILM